MIASKRCVSLTLGLFSVLASCTQHKSAPGVTMDTAIIDSESAPLLWTDAELDAESYSAKGSEELFDDFLYNYVQDTIMQRERAIFPVDEILIDGSSHQISETEWSKDYYFPKADYTTALYNNEAEMTINEDTALLNASVEKIDLEQEVITIYDFMRHNNLWNLVAIRHMRFADSDLMDFLQFYVRFASDESFRNSSLPRSIHISMPDPDDESQSIDGFVSREQWPTIAPVLPEGTIMNIRYGQHYLHSKRILMEKTSIGDGMSEVFSFAKEGRGWELVGYEN